MRYERSSMHLYKISRYSHQLLYQCLDLDTQINMSRECRMQALKLSKQARYILHISTWNITSYTGVLAAYLVTANGGEGSDTVWCMVYGVWYGTVRYDDAIRYGYGKELGDIESKIKVHPIVYVRTSRFVGQLTRCAGPNSSGLRQRHRRTVTKQSTPAERGNLCSLYIARSHKHTMTYQDLTALTSQL